MVPVHPGEILDELYLKPLGLSAGGLARSLGVPRTRIERLVTSQTGLSTDTALRLAKAFNTRPQYWINMQTNFDLATADIDVSGIEDLTAA